MVKKGKYYELEIERFFQHQFDEKLKAMTAKTASTNKCPVCNFWVYHLFPIQSAITTVLKNYVFVCQQCRIRLLQLKLIREIPGLRIEEWEKLSILTQ